MTRRSKEISIFNLSMLDVIFGAMGAFMLLFLMVMLELRPPCAPCKRSAFFVAWIDWTQQVKTDIDLYVISPEGKFCGFVKKHEIGPPRMDLLWDYTDGGPNHKETILVPEATAGRWKIAYHHYSGGTAQVTGYLRGSAGLSKQLSTIEVTHSRFGQRSTPNSWGGLIVLEFDVTSEGDFTNFSQTIQ